MNIDKKELRKEWNTLMKCEYCGTYFKKDYKHKHNKTRKHIETKAKKEKEFVIDKIISGFSKGNIHLHLS